MHAALEYLQRAAPKLVVIERSGTLMENGARREVLLGFDAILGRHDGYEWAFVLSKPDKQQLGTTTRARTFFVGIRSLNEKE